jgi:hypothetical protein
MTRRSKLVVNSPGALVSPIAPAAVTASTTTGLHDRHATLSTTPAISAQTVMPAGLAAAQTAFITEVSAGARCARPLAGWFGDVRPC